MNNEVEVYKKSDWLSKEEKSVIDRQFFPQGATIDDKRYCMQVAEAFGLNPILKQIYFIPRKTKVDDKWVEKTEPFTGRDSFLLIAHRTGLFNGLETTSELREVPFLNQGKWDIKKDLVAICKVYKKNCDLPFVAEVNYSEYVQKKSNGEVTKIWIDMPITMIKKVAESQALRKAFNITINSSDEIQNDIIEAKVSEEKPTKPKSLNDIQNQELDLDEITNNLYNQMKESHISEDKAKEYLKTCNDEKLMKLYKDVDFFENECMNLVI